MGRMLRQCLDGDDGHRRQTLAFTDESQPVRGGGLHRDISYIQAEHSSEVATNRLPVG